LRILHLLAPAPVGGLETVVLNLARAQQESGVEVLVAPILEPGFPFDHPFLMNLDRWDIDRSVVSVSARRYLLERKKVRDLVSDFQPGILHTHGYRPEILHGRVARSAGVPVISTAHGLTSETMKIRLYEWLSFRAIRRFDAVVAVSKPLGRRLVGAGVPEDRVHIVPNALPADTDPATPAQARTELGLDKGDRAVGWIGRLSWEKGPDIAIRAFAGIRDPDAILAVIGTGPMEAELKALAEELGLGRRVRWYGEVTGAARLLPAFEALFMSSRTEGTPMVLLEAMATATPIVCAGVGGIPDMVSEREAMISRPEDEGALARSLEECLRDRQAAEARAAAASIVLQKKFSVGPWVERYMRIYQSIQQ